MKKIGNCIIVFFVIVTLSTCKKYPENILWFKNPAKLYPFQGHLTKYTVNGIDSLDLLNAYFGNQVGIIKDIRQTEFFTTYSTPKEPRSTFIYIGSGLSTNLYYSFGCKKKCLKISLKPDTLIYKKSLFISDKINWQIIRLDRNGIFKIETVLSNGNKYEIEIGS